MNFHLIVCTSLLTLLLAASAQSAEKSMKQSNNPTAGSTAAVAKPAAPKNVDPTSGIEFVDVKGGCYQMGDVFGDGSANEKPVHEVCVGDFSIGKYEVTQVQWQSVMGKNPSSRSACGSDCPVENVSWDMAQAFIDQLNSKGTAKFRLPTEAEWEYAARSGGKKEKWAGTSDEKKLPEFAWFAESAKAMMWKVGQRKPNGLGLFDMSGNAYEWCQDYFDDSYYSKSPKDNPLGPATGEMRVLRSGAFGLPAQDTRAAYRRGDLPDTIDGDYSFRLIRISK